MKKTIVASIMSIALAVGLMPAPALAQTTLDLVAASSGTTLAAQADKKPVNATKKKMAAAYREVLKQAKAGTGIFAEARESTLGISQEKWDPKYAVYDMGGDGVPELIVLVPPYALGQWYHVFDFASGKARYLGKDHTASGWLYGTPNGQLFCACGRQGMYYVKRLEKASGKFNVKDSYKTFHAKDYNDWDAAKNRMHEWLAKKRAKSLQTKPVTNYSLLNSKIKVTYKMSEAKVSVTPSKTYTGKAVKPKVTVKVGGTTLKAGKGYAVTYRNAKGKRVSAPKAVGTYKVTITGKGNLKGSVTKSFKVARPTTANRNAEARSALKNKLKALYEEYRDYGAPSNGFTGMRYRFADLNNDKVDELLVSQDNHWQPMNSVFGFSSGEVVAISSSSFSVGEGVFDHRIVSYKKRGVFKVHDWHGYYARDRYYKWNGKTSKLVASREDDAIWSGHNYTYYVNGAKVSKSKFNAYVKKITKGAKARDFSTETGWRTYK